MTGPSEPDGSPAPDGYPAPDGSAALDGPSALDGSAAPGGLAEPDASAEPGGPRPPGPVPDGVTDRMLWLAAQGVLQRHWPRTGPIAFPATARGCAQCNRPWPCQPYQLAREAERLAGLPRPAAPDDGTPPDDGPS
ncbi:MAG: hypothetical protein WCA46_25995, partial [Actinocatenispora sp.]